MNGLTHTRRIVLLVSLVLTMNLTAKGQASAPATTANSDFSARITGIEGQVEARSTSEDNWHAAKIGDVLPEGSEIRTLVRSAVRFVIPPDQTITLDRLGALKILRSSFENGKIVTDFGMKYGRTHYEIDAQGRQHDAKVHSPSSVLAIRGTDVILEDQPPFAPRAVSLTGRAFFRDVHKEIAFGNAGAGTTKVNEQDASAANTALGNTAADPHGKFSGRTQADKTLQLSLAAYGGRDFSDLGVLAFFDQARAGNFKGSFAGSLPIGRQLEFDLLWTGAASTDVDLSVTSPRGEVVSPTNVTVPSSGHYFGNNIADESGNGQEQIVWEISYPVGNYVIKATLKRGTSVKANVFVVDDPQGTLPTSGQSIGHISGTLTPKSPVLTGTVNATGKLQQLTPQSIKKATVVKTAQTAAAGRK